MNLLLKKMLFFTVLFFNQAGTTFSQVKAVVTSEKKAAATKIRFESLSTREGLSNDWISAIHQDKSGFIWIGTQYGINKFDGSEFTYYSYDPNDTNSLGGNWVTMIAEDQEGKLWLGNAGNGISVFDPVKETFKRYTEKNSNLYKNGLQCISIDEQNRVWLGHFAGGLGHWNPLESKFEMLKVSENPGSNHIKAISPAGLGQLWLGTLSGLYLFEIATQKFTHLPYKDGQNLRISSLALMDEKVLWVGTMDSGLKEFNLESLKYTENEWFSNPVGLVQVNSIVCDGNQRVWLGTKSGLFKLETNSHKIYPNQVGKPESVNSVLSMFLGRSGVLWVGRADGLHFTRYKQSFFEKNNYGIYGTEIDELHTIRKVLQTADSVIWLGTYQGLYRFDPNASNPELEKVISDVAVYSLLEAKDKRIWCGTLGGDGCYLINPSQSNSIEKTEFASGSELSEYESVFDIAEDSQGNIWLATKSLYLWNKKSKEFQQVDLDPDLGMGKLIILCLEFDEKDDLYMGQLGGGFTCLHNLQSKNRNDVFYETYWYDPLNKESLTNNTVLYLFSDSRKKVWVATDAGLNQFDPEKRSFTRFLRSDGLLDDKIMSIEEDDQGHIWLSTIGHGLVMMQPDEKRFSHFNITSGLNSNAFLMKSSFKNKDGFLFFGNMAGLTIFHPDSIKLSNDTAPVFITRLLVNNQEVEIGAEAGPLDQHINFTQKIELEPWQNTLTFGFCLLNYQFPGLNRYQIQLEGLDREWVDISDRKEITFSELSAGKYILKVRAKIEGQESYGEIRRLEILISPYWYQTSWAYGLYFLLALAIVLVFYRFNLKRALDKREVLKLKELDITKDRLHANIVHEFRTPITLITGPISQVLENLEDMPPTEVEQRLRLAQNNSQHLLNLINQMMDMSKLKSGMLQPELVYSDIVEFLKSTWLNFQPAAETKGVAFHFYPPKEKILTHYDPQKLIYIVSNLLSNAIKFTAVGGWVRYQVEVRNRNVVVVVEDNGRGISNEDLPHIFERFFQVRKRKVKGSGGTGIGLAFTYELVDILGGKIQVESKLGEGSRFQVSLPLTTKEKTIIQKPESGLEHFLTEETSPTKEPLILIVEDNPEMATYIASCLKNYSNIKFAEDGLLGTERALELIPDLIISDVMMPERDGVQMCGILKSDIRTSHIPIVLLTAKIAISARLEGLEGGADVYLEKPFHEKELQLQVKNLLASREKLHSWFLNHSDPGEARLKQSGSANPALKTESEFLTKITEIVQAAMLEKTDFDIPMLCKEIGISRTQLHRKITALTGSSTTIFINSVRLVEAKKLLQSTDLNIAEIAYETGFKDPNYFSRIFAKTYGKSPSKFRKGE